MYNINIKTKEQIEFEDGTGTTYVIFEGRFTKQYMCRDCGSYYEIDLGTQLIKIPKRNGIKRRK